MRILCVGFRAGIRIAIETHTKFDTPRTYIVRCFGFPELSNCSLWVPKIAHRNSGCHSQSARVLIEGPGIDAWSARGSVETGGLGALGDACPGMCAGHLDAHRPRHCRLNGNIRRLTRPYAFTSEVVAPSNDKVKPIRGRTRS